MNNETTVTQKAIDTPKALIEFLTGQGWKASSATVYRHIEEKRVKRNDEGVFEAAKALRYARKYLKRLPSHLKTCENKDNLILKIPEVSAYLHSRGWHAPRQTFYQHIKRGVLRRNGDGYFDVLDLEKYARKHLKPLAVTNIHSQKMAVLFNGAMEIFFRSKAKDIVSFVSGDASRTEDLKSFLITEAGAFFRIHQKEADHHSDDGESGSDGMFLIQKNDE